LNLTGKRYSFAVSFSNPFCFRGCNTAGGLEMTVTDRRKKRQEINRFVVWVRQLDELLRARVLNDLKDQGELGELVVQLIEEPDRRRYPWVLLDDDYARNTVVLKIGQEMEVLARSQASLPATA
jgi:hypothetical protein